MSHLLALLQSLAFVGLFLAMVAAPGWFIFTFNVIAFAVFIILSTTIFHASLNAAPNRKSEWGFALLQVKLGGLILHAALGIILALDYSSYSRSIAHQAALIVIGIGVIMLIGTAFIQVRSGVTRLSTRGFIWGLAATFLSLLVCWLAINETFYVFYIVFAFWAIKAIRKITPFALSTRNRLYWTIALLVVWIIISITVYVVTVPYSRVFT